MAQTELTHRRLLVFVVVWAIGAILLAILQRPLWNYLWIASFGVTISYAVIGVVFLLAALWNAWKSRRDPRKLRGFLIAAGTIVVAGIAFVLIADYLEPSGNAAVARARFGRNRSTKDSSTIQAAPSGPHVVGASISDPRSSQPR